MEAPIHRNAPEDSREFPGFTFPDFHILFSALLMAKPWLNTSILQSDLQSAQKFTRNNYNAMLGK